MNYTLYLGCYTNQNKNTDAMKAEGIYRLEISEDGKLMGKPVLEAAILAGQEALKETVNQNPVLKKAGVVDAGAWAGCMCLRA